LLFCRIVEEFNLYTKTKKNSVTGQKSIKNMFSKIIKFSLLPIFGALLWGCSQFSEGFFSKTYHNTTAKYNAYLQAKDLLKVAELTLEMAHKDDFGKMLPILLPIDSTQSQAVATQLESVIKKASIVAERHQNSKWLDDAYLLIGKARLLKEDYANATETFKYINTQSSNEDTKHTALINLMRAYLEQDDLTSGLRVAEYLREQDLNKANTRDYYLTKAYLHQLKGEYEISTGILEEAFKLMKKTEQTARVHFAAGQMYDLLGQTGKAVLHYKAVEKNNPSYDLSFNAGLNALMGTQDGGTKLEANFKNMLDDRKNGDQQDKIYLTMARRELQAKNYKQAIINYKTAIQKANGNQATLWTSFLALAEINYEQLQNYEEAKAYYDSTVTALPQNSKNYEQIATKKKSLDEFVKQITVIRTEDSLQKLAQMNPTALDKYLDKILKEKALKEKQDIELAQKIANKIAGAGQLTRGNGGAESSNFYFYTPSTVFKGKDDFVQKWGIRKLEDNWRRANKDIDAFANSNIPATNKAKGSLNAIKLDSDNMASTVDLKTEKENILKKIPFGQAEMVESRNKQEEAYFQLGKIYKLNLNEPLNAGKTFEKMLTLFPNTKHEEEALYLLCLLTENQANNPTWKSKLNERYGNGYYARLLNRSSNGQLGTGADSDAQKLYANAYQLYQDGSLTDAMIAVDNGLKNYPNNSIEDKFALLKAILLAKNQQLPLYQKTLEDFLRDYPSSKLVPMAKEMLTAAQQGLK
jgi:outer membrane protein assembly factor BamD (BamD/ComL family)